MVTSTWSTSLAVLVREHVSGLLDSDRTWSLLLQSMGTGRLDGRCRVERGRPCSCRLKAPSVAGVHLVERRSSGDRNALTSSSHFCSAEIGSGVLCRVLPRMVPSKSSFYTHPLSLSSSNNLIEIWCIPLRLWHCCRPWCLAEKSK